MAYSLHIERDTPIGESEWLRIVEQDKSLTIEHKAVSENPTSNEVIELAMPNSCVWVSPFLRRRYVFTYSNGSITFGAGKAQLKKAKKLARLLDAKVVGDEGEIY